MSFRIALVASKAAAAPANGEFNSAVEVFAAYRRCLRRRVRVREVVDLRAGDPRLIAGAELEAIEWCEHRDGYQVRDLWNKPADEGNRA